ncbi:MAG: outer membrane protein assembly factor BamD [Deltaproteobacteria bacterium]|nr:outer membrane protein assembly factor BamD [Deltaproteobacteria bacterium]
MIRLVTILVTLALVAGCSESKPKVSADEYYKEASEAFTKKNYEVAVNRYKELLDQYPFSDHAEEAELEIAHAQYKNKHYPEAIAAFNDFQRMHPMSPHLPEVYFLLGKSYMDQMTTTDRDQGASENAHGWFRVVIDRYPTSPFAAQARRKLADCRRSLADHELYVANYYFKRKNLRAGENRVKGILENYSDTLAATRAVEALADAYALAGDSEHESMARAALAERRHAEETVVPTPDPIDTGRKKKHHDDATLAVAPESSGPASALLLADLTARYGIGQGVSTAATAPSLIDPVLTPKTGGRGAPPPPGGNEAPLGGY